jgi:hypothetical protein
MVIVLSREHGRMFAAQLLACGYLVAVADPIEEAAPRLDSMRAQLEATKAAEKIPPAKRPHWDRRAGWGKPWR